MDLVTRVTNIVTKPDAEWTVIAAEPADVPGLLRDYAAPLAAIPAICSWIGLSVVGVSVLFQTYRVPFLRGFSHAVLTWVFALVGAWIAAIVIEKLAPSFKSHGDTVQALKLVVYASTPVWVAGVLNLIPALSPLVIVAALYSIYLFYLGLPRIMSTPAEQVIPYMVVAALVVIVVTVLLGALAGALVGVGGMYRTF